MAIKNIPLLSLWKRTFLAGLAFFLITTLTYAQQWEWANIIQSSDGKAHNFSVAVDKNKNSYVTGAITGKVTIDNYTLTSSSITDSDPFIAKFDSEGKCIWVKNFQGTGYGLGHSIASDLEGNIFVAGKFKNTLNIDNTVLTAQGETDMFVAKFNTYGDLTWVNKASGFSATVDPGGIAVDIASGECYATGYYGGGSVKFGNYSLNATNSFDIFIVKYDKAGDVAWVTNAGGPYIDGGTSIAAYKGRCYVTGTFRTSAQFGNITLTANPFQQDGFVACYRSPFPSWVKQLKGINDANINSNGIAVDKEGSSYITGSFYGQVDFGAGILTSPFSTFNMFIAKFDAHGNSLWANKIKSNGNFPVIGECISIDPASNIVYAGGEFSNNVILNNISYPAINITQDAFVVRLKSDGAYIDAQQIASIYKEELSSIIAFNNQYWVAGYTNSHDNPLHFIHEISNPNSLIKTASISSLYDKAFLARYDYTLNNALPEINNFTTNGNITTVLSVFPSIVQNLVYVKANNVSTNAKLIIQTMDGRIVTAKPYQPGVPNDVSSLTPGIYMAIVQDGNKQLKAKFIKE